MDSNIAERTELGPMIVGDYDYRGLNVDEFLSNFLHPPDIDTVDVDGSFATLDEAINAPAVQDIAGVKYLVLWFTAASQGVATGEAWFKDATTGQRIVARFYVEVIN